MQVTRSKIQVPIGAEVVEVKDGSIRIIKYTATATDKDLLELIKSNNYYDIQSNRYTLQVNLPCPDKMLYSVHILRPSANSYKLLYSDKDKTELVSLSNHGEINAYLKQLQSPK